MSETKKSITVGGTGFFNLLFLVFLVLKLTKVIDWSWWWITAPLWGPIAALIFLAIFGGLLVVLCGTLTSGRSKI